LTDDTFTEYLEGALDPAIKAASEVHLIACDDCRNRLSFFMRLLNEEVTPEEDQQVQALMTAWQEKKQAREVPRRTGTVSRWLLGLVAVAGIAIVGLSIRFMIGPSAQPQSA